MRACPPLRSARARRFCSYVDGAVVNVTRTEARLADLERFA
jgi:hypothetical protein